MAELTRELKLIEEAELLYMRLFVVAHDERSFLILYRARESYERRVTRTASTTREHFGRVTY